MLQNVMDGTEQNFVLSFFGVCCMRALLLLFFWFWYRGLLLGAWLAASAQAGFLKSEDLIGPDAQAFILQPYLRRSAQKVLDRP